jgi:hypothetical protein
MSQNPPERVINWADSSAPHFGQWNAYSPEAVVKIVIGASPNSRDANKPLAIDLNALALWLPKFEKLTHLYLWNIAGLKSLPSLPSGLQCLDVRGCTELESLPELPASLETLDLGGCAGMKGLRSGEQLPALCRFYFNGCAALETEELEMFLKQLKKSESPLTELDGSETPAVTTLRNFPVAKLRKLVLRGCEKLVDVSLLREATHLDHLQLAGCVALKELPNLPLSVRYLVLHGSEELKLFMRQDIGSFDRGTPESQNVAKIFHSRRKFGGESAASAHAKLLLMGDGRVGKSTLAKRLIWDSLTQEQRDAHPELKPKRGEKFTEKVRFCRWETPLQLTPAQAHSLNERASVQKLPPPCDQQDCVRGTVRLFDFGGQEIYHLTHRIFASEGAVFLLVWKAGEPDWQEIERENMAGVDPRQWREWNRPRKLEYWMDYILSLRPDAKIALVCSCSPMNAKKEPWGPRLGTKHASRKGLECFHIESVEDEDCAKNPEYARLVNWIRIACGAEAARIGIWQPRFFGEVAAQVEALLQENDRQRQSHVQAEHLLIDGQRWEDMLRKSHAGSGSAQTLDADDVAAITGYLHDAGQIFRIEHAGNSAVLVDPAWAVDILYSLLRPGEPLTRKIVDNGGWFAQSELENSAHWRLLPNDLHRQRLIAYMQECCVIARIADARETRFEETLFLATEKWLLPSYSQMEERVEARMRQVAPLLKMEVRQEFSFEETEISEFDFRRLAAHLAKAFGRHALWFQDGLMAVDDPRDPGWCFRVRWKPANKDDLMGKLDADLTTAHERLASLGDQMEELFTGPDCPLRSLRKPRRTRAESRELDHSFFRPLHGADYDIAVSSSGADQVEAAALVGALKAEKFKVAWYRDEECRWGDLANLMNFMKSLSLPPVIVLLISDGYLSHDLANKWYCPWELADAVNHMAIGSRDQRQTVVVYKQGQAVNSKNIDSKAAALFEELRAHFAKLYSENDCNDEAFGYYNDLKKHFSSAKTHIHKFFENRGSLGYYSHIETRPDGTTNYDEVLKHVREGLTVARGQKT